MAKRIGHYFNQHSWRQNIANVGPNAPTQSYDDTSCISGNNGRSERVISGANNALEESPTMPLPRRAHEKSTEGRQASRRRNQVWVGKLRASRFKIPVASKHAYRFWERYRRNCRLAPSLLLQPPSYTFTRTFLPPICSLSSQPPSLNLRTLPRYFLSYTFTNSFLQSLITSPWKKAPFSLYTPPCKSPAFLLARSLVASLGAKALGHCG